MKVWTYVIATDSGAAPNFDEPFATLAICKPLIRRSAGVGDMLIAFSGRALSPEPHSVRWAGIVSEVLDFSTYWRDPRFETKKPDRSSTPDNIYEPLGTRYRQIDNPIHGPGNVTTDLRGNHVLVFGRTWYFGPAAPRLPATFGLHMVTGRRGHRLHHLKDPLARELIVWLDDNLLELEPNDLANEQATSKSRTCRSRTPPTCARPK